MILLYIYGISKNNTMFSNYTYRIEFHQVVMVHIQRLQLPFLHRCQLVHIHETRTLGSTCACIIKSKSINAPTIYMYVYTRTHRLRLHHQPMANTLPTVKHPHPPPQSHSPPPGCTQHHTSHPRATTYLVMLDLLDY